MVGRLIAIQVYMYTLHSLSRGHQMTAADTAVVTVRLDGELKAKLEALARHTRRSKSFLAAEAIAAYADLNEWRIAEIEAGIAELDDGKIVSDDEAAERYDRLLKPR
jgi:RHH-type transcriptional regulator, rel operon repressor / antitoxin RelB